MYIHCLRTVSLHSSSHAHIYRVRNQSARTYRSSVPTVPPMVPVSPCFFPESEGAAEAGADDGGQLSDGDGRRRRERLFDPSHGRRLLQLLRHIRHRQERLVRTHDLWHRLVRGATSYTVLDLCESCLAYV